MSGSMFDTGDAVDWSAGIIPGTTSNADPMATGVAGSAGLMVGTGTGRLGVVPLENTGGGMTSSVQAVWQWLNKPFKSALDPVDLFLLVGVILIAVIAWNLILYHVRIAAESI
jgi:hypothetical protein